MAIVAPGQPARSVDPVPETESNNALTQGSLSAENAEVPVGASALSENASHGEDVDEEILSPSQVESHETQVNPNWTPTVYGEVIPPIALSEIGSIVDGHQPSGEGLLPSALFVLPFPAPLNAHRGKNTPPFLMYSPPRSVYQKPPKRDDGKRPKEKILKKVVRVWQEEVVMGEKIKRGELENPTRFKKIRGGCIRVASSINKWLPNSCIETLGRLPPKRKLGGVTIIHPVFGPRSEEDETGNRDRPYQPTTEELLNDIGVLLRKTRKRVLTRAIIAGMLLPISLGIDVFAPVFAFEINVTYFAFQIYGLKKCNALTSPRKNRKTKRSKRPKIEGGSNVEEATLLVGNSPAEVPHEGAITTPEENFQFKSAGQLDPVMVLLYNICAKIDPVSFPPLTPCGAPDSDSNSPPSSQASTLPPSLKRPGGAVVKEMIQAFRDTLPPDVTERYLLDEEKLSEDLARYLKKASKEYVESLSGRGNRKGVIYRVKIWKQKSAGRKEQKALKSLQKKEAKKQKKEATSPAEAAAT
ncbi:hypothetical protein PCANC_27736 [Puccinia coronata f. sp. avenae]|uniref:Uncharacterized protein n=2 Tax=Puccinia coronata f. sp. avenae TaxID=200324 RepID=A0A2N5RUX3_9BASI|nr:hypothetical protein PCANC_27736 [Puccinia coronata f. sp. avenae]